MSDDDDVPLDEDEDRGGTERDVPVDPPTAGADDEPGDDAASESTPPAAEDEPLEALAERIRSRREYEETEEIEKSPFESMEVDQVDSDEVWDELFEEEDEEMGGYLGVGGQAERVADSANAEFVVDKATFCKRCPFLDDPPNLRCTHEGTEILEVVDTEHFRVRECPMVERRDDRFGDI